MSEFSDDFIRGQSDCIRGDKHLQGQSEAYDRGYNTEYEAEQLVAESNRRQENERSN